MKGIQVAIITFLFHHVCHAASPCAEFFGLLDDLGQWTLLSPDQFEVVEIFYGRKESNRYFDKTLQKQALPVGQEFKEVIPIQFNNHKTEILAFHRFPTTEGKNFAALSGISVISFRQFAGVGPHPRLQWEPRIRQFLATEGIKVSRVFEVMVEQNAIAGEYIHGFSIHQLRQLRDRFEITRSEYRTALRKLERVKEKFEEVLNSEQYREFLEAEGLEPPALTFDPNRFIYREGSWIFTGL